MWFKVSEELSIPAGELVGIFAPGVLGPDDKDAPARSVALMKDGRALPMPVTLKTIAARFAAANEQGARSSPHKHKQGD